MAARRSAGCPRARGPAARPHCAARSRPSPRWRSGRCRRRTPTPRRAARAAMARIPDPQPTSSTRAPRRRRGRPATRPRRGTAGSSDGARSRTPSPGSSARTTSSGARRWRRQVGRMTSRRPMRMTGKYAFHASAQSASWTTRVRSSPIGRSPNACRCPSAVATSATARSVGRTVARRQVCPDGRRPGRVHPRAEAFVDELECGLDRGPAGRRAAEDLADRLDRLDVRLDRELEPGAGSSLRAAGVAQPSPSFSSSPPPPCPTDSPASWAYASSSSRAFFDSFVGTTTSTITWRSPR